MQLELRHLLQPRVLVEFAQDHLWDRLPWALLAVGVVVGGLVVTWLVKFALGLCCLPRKYREKLVLVRKGKDGKPVFQPSTRKLRGSVAHLLLETFFFVAIVIVLWIAAHIAGFNFWTSSLVGVGMGLVGTYIFGAALQNIGAGYFVFLTDKVEEGWYVRVAGVEGRIIEIHPLFVEMESISPGSGGALHHQVPMLVVLTSIVTRDFNKEAEMEPTTINPDHYLPRARQGRRPQLEGDSVVLDMEPYQHRGARKKGR